MPFASGQPAQYLLAMPPPPTAGLDAKAADQSAEDRPGLVIVGIGNLLCGDDGLGVIAAEELQRRYRIPGEVPVLDGGTRGLALLPFLAGAKNVLLVDAVLEREGPGALVRLEGGDLAASVRRPLSGHGIGVSELVGALRLIEGPPHTLLLGLVPKRVGTGVGLSPEVRQGLPHLLEAIAAEAARLGFPLRQN